MSDIEARLKANHAAVFLTLVSVVVALALEDLLSQVRGSTELWQADPTAVRVWLKVSLAFVATFGLWVAYSTLLLSLYWLLGIWDATQVFLLAVFLYVCNSLAFIEPGYLLLYAGAAFIISGNVILFTNLKRARRYDENHEILRRTSYRSALWFGFTLGGAALLSAILEHARGAGGAVEGALHLGFTVGLLVWLWLFMRGWRRSVSTSTDAAA